MNGACNGKIFLPRPLWPLGGVKGQISFNFNYKVNFKDFCTKLCVQNISDRIFILLPRSCLGVGLWGAGGAQVVKKKISNMVMWHIKSTGMTSRTECK